MSCHCHRTDYAERSSCSKRSVIAFLAEAVSRDALGRASRIDADDERQSEWCQDGFVKSSSPLRLSDGELEVINDIGGHGGGSLQACDAPPSANNSTPLT